MRRPKRARGRAAPSNLDSFLDTLTNTVGVMIFVLLFVTLSAADATILVRTPLRTATQKEEIFFEVRGDRVAQLDSRAGAGEFSRFMERLPRPSLWNLAYIIERVYGYSGDTENHSLSVVGNIMSGNLGLSYRMKENAGDTLKALRRADSHFQRILARADTSRQFVAFIVREDGFEAFREARKQATARGFQSGWEPIQSSSGGVVFSSRGRTVGVQ